jgi:hypothetical protein
MGFYCHVIPDRVDKKEFDYYCHLKILVLSLQPNPNSAVSQLGARFLLFYLKAMARRMLKKFYPTVGFHLSTSCNIVGTWE